MKYFVLAPQRNGSCYYEFYKGKWDNKTFWKEDSICIHDDVVFQHEIDKLIMEVAPNYNPFGETEIQKEQWQKLVVLSKDINVGVANALLNKECIEKVDVEQFRKANISDENDYKKAV